MKPRSEGLNHALFLFLLIIFSFMEVSGALTKDERVLLHVFQFYILLSAFLGGTIQIRFATLLFFFLFQFSSPPLHSSPPDASACRPLSPPTPSRPVTVFPPLSWAVQLQCTWVRSLLASQLLPFDPSPRPAYVHAPSVPPHSISIPALSPPYSLPEITRQKAWLATLTWDIFSFTYIPTPSQILVDIIYY